jgi:hypothetical protein
MEALLKAKGDEKSAEPIVEVVEEPAHVEPEIKNPKLKALLKIIRGEEPESKEPVSSKIKHLLEGRVDLPA